MWQTIVRGVICAAPHSGVASDATSHRLKVLLDNKRGVGAVLWWIDFWELFYDLGVGLIEQVAAGESDSIAPLSDYAHVHAALQEDRFVGVGPRNDILLAFADMNV